MFSKQDKKIQIIIIIIMTVALLAATVFLVRSHDNWHEDQETDFQLENIVLQAESKGATTHLNWNKVAGASRYELLRYYAGSKKYKLYRTIEATENDAETIEYDMGREAGRYKIRAVLEIGEKRFESESEESIRIKSTTEKARTYSSMITIKEISSKDVECIANADGNDHASHAQAMCVIDDAIVVALVNRGNDKGALESFTKDGKEMKTVNAGDIGHANGCTCNPNKDEIYVMTAYASSRSKEVRVFDQKTYKSKDSLILKTAPSAIAYDRSNDKYYYTASNRIYVADGNMSREKTVYRKRYYHSQDVAGYNGVIMSCIWISGSQSFIDMYRESDGAYLGSISTPLGEIESCCIDDGYLLMLFNGGNIYKTKKRIQLA